MPIKKGKAANAVSKLFSEQTREAYEAQEAHKAYETSKTHEVREAYETQDEQAYSAARTQGRKGKKAARMTMAFSDENMEYIRTMGRLEQGGATAYVNRLIEADRKRNASVYAQMKAFRPIELNRSDNE